MRLIASTVDSSEDFWGPLTAKKFQARSGAHSSWAARPEGVCVRLHALGPNARLAWA